MAAFHKKPNTYIGEYNDNKTDNGHPGHSFAPPAFEIMAMNNARKIEP